MPSRLNDSGKVNNGKRRTVLDIDAIYTAVRTVQSGIVKKLASRGVASSSTLYKQQEEEEHEHPPMLQRQILKQQVAAETKPREEAWAELICEAQHAGAEVVWHDEAEHTCETSSVRTMTSMAKEAGEALSALAAMLEAGDVTPDQAREVLRELQEAQRAYAAGIKLTKSFLAGSNGDTRRAIVAAHESQLAH